MEKKILEIKFEDFNYLIPPKEYENIEHTGTLNIPIIQLSKKILDFYIKHKKGEKSIRKIYHFVSYDEFEKEMMQQLKKLIEQDNLQLPEEYLQK